jgi:hypothetical protein
VLESIIQAWGRLQEVCIRTIHPERELTDKFTRRIVSASRARSVTNKGNLCALLDMKST